MRLATVLQDPPRLQPLLLSEATLAAHPAMALEAGPRFHGDLNETAAAAGPAGPAAGLPPSAAAATVTATVTAAQTCLWQISPQKRFRLTLAQTETISSDPSETVPLHTSSSVSRLVIENTAPCQPSP